MPIAALLVLLVASFVAPASTAVLACPIDVTPDFSDACHHEYILYDVDQSEIDVLILPSASPFILRDSIILRQSVQAWEDGIDNMGPAWLGTGVNLHPYSVGMEYVPYAALWDPEIVIISGEVNPALLAGIGLQAPASWCHGLASPLSAQGIAQSPGFHQHEGSSWGMLASSCTNGGYTCFVVNTNFLLLPDAANRRDMFDLNSHELGHCLGIGHVGDATLDFVAASYPEDDIMSYESDGHDAGHVLCVSTLNIKALKQVYGAILGQAGYPASAAGTYVSEDATLWADDSCAEPTVGYTDPAPYIPCNPISAPCACPPPFTGNLPPAGSGCVPPSGELLPMLSQPVCVGVQITDDFGARTATASCLRDPTGTQTTACSPMATIQGSASAQFVCTVVGNNWCDGTMVETIAAVSNPASSAMATVKCNAAGATSATANGLIAPLSQAAFTHNAEAASGAYSCTLSFTSGNTLRGISVAACQSLHPIGP